MPLTFEWVDCVGFRSSLVEPGEDCHHLCINIKCPPQADFVISNMKGEEVGSISKTSSSVGKELFTDGDRFVINFPPGCLPEMKATLLAATILFDFLFYED